MSGNHYFNMMNLRIHSYDLGNKTIGYRSFDDKNKIYIINSNLTFGLIYSKLHVNERKFIHRIIFHEGFFDNVVKNKGVIKTPYNRLIFFPLNKIYYIIYSANISRRNYFGRRHYFETRFPDLKESTLDIIIDKLNKNVPFEQVTKLTGLLKENTA